MPARSLYDMAKIATIRNIDLLTDIGYLPYSFMRPILLKLENPDQLRALEKTCPQLLGEDGEVWLKFIKRDIPKWETKRVEPKNPENWWKVYRKLVKEAEQEARDAEEVLKQQMADINAKRVANTITAPTMMIPENGVKKRSGPTTFSRVADKSSLRFTGGSKTKNVMDRARREAAESRLRKNGRLTTPTHLLASGIVRQAPQAMIDNRRQEASRPAAFKLSRPATAGIAKAPMRPQAPASGLADREARLKALQSGSKPPPTQHTPLAPGASYRVPPLGRTGLAPPRTGSPFGTPASSPAPKRKREADVFMKNKKR
jgi:elongin-A